MRPWFAHLAPIMGNRSLSGVLLPFIGMRQDGFIAWSGVRWAVESAVLLEAVQFGAQGCLGEVLFPQTRVTVQPTHLFSVFSLPDVFLHSGRRDEDDEEREMGDLAQAGRRLSGFWVNDTGLLCAGRHLGSQLLLLA